MQPCMLPAVYQTRRYTIHAPCDWHCSDFVSLWPQTPESILRSQHSKGPKSQSPCFSGILPWDKLFASSSMNLTISDWLQEATQSKNVQDFKKKRYALLPSHIIYHHLPSWRPPERPCESCWAIEGLQGFSQPDGHRRCSTDSSSSPGPSVEGDPVSLAPIPWIWYLPTNVCDCMCARAYT